MPTHKFKKYLKYKCNERGVPFVLVDKACTTQPCSRCNERVGRLNNKEFEYPNCGLKIHADRNGAINIKERGLDKLDLEPLPMLWASLTTPKTLNPVLITL
ncbi:MAG: IS605 OrfB-like transposable element containing RNAse H-like and Zn finger domain [Candidatus Methanohalarchaeum thermophilum]|uniref:IS605 OrfB-like transposable element containing RNAse H-like and Zn finger domain n=1 Tax=Methanohalarchaeum thermophilum TaxID=1903181 RepID=A0A1Q6DWA9_METT1|nr:MAG: IS605 OrfB-like transposable element containing RNAse H-like and Zn finger domain [Candidatus Methanohalarchaeum thermophilum]